MMEQTRMMRSSSDRVLAGVCGGLAVYLDVEPALVRLAFLLLIPASGIGLLLYILLAILMPPDTAPNRIDRETARVRQKIEILNEEAPAGQRAPINSRGPTLIGFFLILVGLYFLLDLSWLSFLIWPSLLIGLGIYFIMRYRASA